MPRGEKLGNNKISHLKIDIDMENYETPWTPIYIALKAYPHGAIYHLTRKGIHIKIPSLPDNINLRYYFMDCPHRLEMDMEREKWNLPTNVLFISKNGKKVHITSNIEEVIEWLMMKWREMKRKR